MQRLNWRDPALAVAPPRVRVERFRGTARRVVHLLGEVRAIKTHHKDKENTVPCLESEGQACPFCAEPLWRPRYEFFGPALHRNDADMVWEPVVAVFTQGGWNKLKSCPGGMHRGRLLKVWRRTHGNATGGVLMLEEVSRIEPVVPGFDIEPHLLRLWFPSDPELPAVEIPPAVPFTAEEVPAHAVKPVTVKLSTAQLREAVERAGLRAYLGQAGATPEAKPGELEVIETAATPAAYGPRKHVAGGPGPRDAGKTPGEELVGEVLAAIPFGHPARPSRNGSHGKGGAK